MSAGRVRERCGFPVAVAVVAACAFVVVRGLGYRIGEERTLALPLEMGHPSLSVESVVIIQSALVTGVCVVAALIVLAADASARRAVVRAAIAAGGVTLLGAIGLVVVWNAADPWEYRPAPEWASHIWRSVWSWAAVPTAITGGLLLAAWMLGRGRHRRVLVLAPIGGALAGLIPLTLGVDEEVAMVGLGGFVSALVIVDVATVIVFVLTASAAARLDRRIRRPVGGPIGSG
ncbi:MAG: hypothetical protein QM809_07560 [Gordonia sp. (in: high G+C Gram-positive bacteria)]|uniref:hypothetical protein n=1 Tax=Gordonia sp. (in: high G+C Gram-positive bacteria) TaxID=84139 RepID=UPI0039E404FE